jgi:hypothetical protein
MESERFISKRQQWFSALILTVLAAFCLEVFEMLYGTIFSDKVSDFVPWTFHWVWEIFALFGLYFIVKRFQIPPGAFFIVAIFIGLIFTTVIWLFVPDSLNIKANYLGVQSRTTYDTHEEGRYDEQVVYDFSLHKGWLYKAGDSELLKEIKEKSEYNEYVGTKGFLFWQTGVANGFIPYGIEEFNGNYTYQDQIELFFTVGPMVLVECFINGLYYNFLIFLLAQFVWYLIKKEHIWWSK